jgi:hypothetical protein
VEHEAASSNTGGLGGLLPFQDIPMASGSQFSGGSGSQYSGGSGSQTGSHYTGGVSVNSLYQVRICFAVLNSTIPSTTLMKKKTKFS